MEGLDASTAGTPPKTPLPRTPRPMNPAQWSTISCIPASSNSTTTTLKKTKEMKYNHSPKNLLQSLTDSHNLVSDSSNTPVASNKLALSNCLHSSHSLHSLHNLHNLHNLHSLHSLEQMEGIKISTTTPLEGMQPCLPR